MASEDFHFPPFVFVQVLLQCEFLITDGPYYILSLCIKEQAQKLLFRPLLLSTGSIEGNEEKNYTQNKRSKFARVNLSWVLFATFSWFLTLQRLVGVPTRIWRQTNKEEYENRSNVSLRWNKNNDEEPSKRVTSSERQN